MKYRPDFPDRFGAIEDARTFCQRFFTWYNTRALPLRHRQRWQAHLSAQQPGCEQRANHYRGRHEHGYQRQRVGWAAGRRPRPDHDASHLAGAVISLPGGWRKAAQNDADFSLCLLPKATPDSYCATVGGGPGLNDWLLLYAGERRRAGDPAFDPRTFSGADMGSFGYDSAPRPCDPADAKTLQQGNGPVGGRSGFYSKFQVTCVKGQGGTFTVQRWMLTASRLGAISYAVTPATAAEVYQIVSTINLTGFQPTTPR